MRQNRTPYWDNLIFSINSEQLSTKQHVLPWLRYLKIHICEHSTGNKIVIPEYPCRVGHSPSIEELLGYLLEKSQIYANALDSRLPPHCYMLEKYKLKECSKGLSIFLHTRECFKSLCTILRGTGVDIESLRDIINRS